MEEIGEKYLPIGTVVMLKGGTKKSYDIWFLCNRWRECKKYV